MRSVLTLVGAVVINLTALAALEWEVNQTAALMAPGGEVTITQLQEVHSIPPLAQAEFDAPEQRRASSTL